MNILWVTNVPLEEASILMNEKPIPFGGWLASSSSALSNVDNVNLSLAFPKENIKELNVYKGKRITYFAFPSVNNEGAINSPPVISSIEELIEESKPDLVHIFGTEYPHTLAVAQICKEKNLKAVISIQGLVSISASHYTAGLPQNVQKRFTIRDFVKQDKIKQQQEKFVKKGELEIKAMNQVNHIIGRTTWDKACSLQINPDLKYHFCNETLRKEFYIHNWDINTCEKYSIFVSQASYPIKGLHYMIEAFQLVLKQYPSAKLYIAGRSITDSVGLKGKLKLSSYGKYIKELINKYDLEGKLVFTGVLNEKQMCERHLKSHVFVLPSTIENSPNSLGEAMILGVPSISSYVGGVPDLLTHGEEGFIYQADAPYMLAHYIKEVFSNNELAQKFSINAKERANKTHSIEINTRQIMKIYQNIVNSN